MSESDSLTPKADSPAPETPTNLKAAAELKKLDLEAEKIALEIKHLRRPPIRHPSAFIPILTSLIALLGLWVTTQQKNQAVAEKNEAVAEKTHAVEATKESQSQTQQQESYSTSLERALEQAQVAPPKTVIIRFRGSLSRENITALQQGLNASGFVAPPPLRTPEVAQSSVTYFHLDDKSLAEEVLSQATAFFNQRDCPIRLQLISLPDQAKNNKPSTILLDIFHSC